MDGVGSPSISELLTLTLILEASVVLEADEGAGANNVIVLEPLMPWARSSSQPWMSASCLPIPLAYALPTKLVMCFFARQHLELMYMYLGRGERISLWFFPLLGGGAELYRIFS